MNRLQEFRRRKLLPIALAAQQKNHAPSLGYAIHPSSPSPRARQRGRSDRSYSPSWPYLHPISLSSCSWAWSRSCASSSRAHRSHSRLPHVRRSRKWRGPCPSSSPQKSQYCIFSWIISSSYRAIRSSGMALPLPLGGRSVAGFVALLDQLSDYQGNSEIVYPLGIIEKC